MPNILDLIATDQSSNDISDAIKDVLYAKSSEKIDGLVAAIMAVDRLTRRVQTEASVYDERGVLTL